MSDEWNSIKKLVQASADPLALETNQVKGRMEDQRALIGNKVSTPMQVTNCLRNEHLVAYSLDFSFKSRQLERGWVSLSLSLLCWLHSTQWRAFRVLDFGGSRDPTAVSLSPCRRDSSSSGRVA